MPKIAVPTEEASSPQSEQAFDVEGFLAALQAAQREQREQQVIPEQLPEPRAVVRPVRRSVRPHNLYEMILARVAISAALIIVAWLWYLGGTYTLAFLASRGVPLVNWGVLAWFIPIGITALEIGVFAARARIPALWLVWVGVLAFDIFTTAAGVLANPPLSTLFGVPLVDTNSSAWLLAGIFGAALALGPEPAARSLVGELVA